MKYLMVVWLLLIFFLPFFDKLMVLGFLLFLSSLVCTLILSMVYNSWFGFILFLMYITGLLVVFVYLMALSPNMFHNQFNFYKNFLFLMFYFFLLLFFKNNKLLDMKLDYEFEVYSIFLFDNLSIYLIMVVLLLVVLFLVVSLCYKTRVPLRKWVN